MASTAWELLVYIDPACPKSLVAGGGGVLKPGDDTTDPTELRDHGGAGARNFSMCPSGSMDLAGV